MTVRTPQPSIAWDDVEAALVAWANEETGLETIWAEEDGPQPNRPFVVLDWLSPPAGVGEDYFDEVADETTLEVERSLQGVRAGTLTVRVETTSRQPNENALYYADILANSVVSNDVVSTHFKPNRMAPWGTQPPRKEDFREGPKAIMRAAFDMRIGFSAGIGQPSETIPYITTVGITGTVTNVTDEYAITASVTS